MTAPTPHVQAAPIALHVHLAARARTHGAVLHQLAHVRLVGGHLSLPLRNLLRGASSISLLARPRPQHVLFGQQQRGRHALHKRVLVRARAGQADHACAWHEADLAAVVRHRAYHLCGLLLRSLVLGGGSGALPSVLTAAGRALPKRPARQRSGMCQERLQPLLLPRAHKLTRPHAHKVHPHRERVLAAAATAQKHGQLSSRQQPQTGQHRVTQQPEPASHCSQRAQPLQHQLPHRRLPDHLASVHVAQLHISFGAGRCVLAQKLAHC